MWNRRDAKLAEQLAEEDLQAMLSWSNWRLLTRDTLVRTQNTHWGWLKPWRVGEWEGVAMELAEDTERFAYGYANRCAPLPPYARKTATPPAEGHTPLPAHERGTTDRELFTTPSSDSTRVPAHAHSGEDMSLQAAALEQAGGQQAAKGRAPLPAHQRGTTDRELFTSPSSDSTRVPADAHSEASGSGKDEEEEQLRVRRHLWQWSRYVAMLFLRLNQLNLYNRTWLLHNASRIRWVQSGEQRDLFAEFRRDVLRWHWGAQPESRKRVRFWLANGWLRPARRTKAEEARRQRWTRTKEAALNSPWREARANEELAFKRKQEKKRKEQERRQQRWLEDSQAEALQQAQEEAKAHAGAGFVLRSPTEESDDEGWPEDPTDAYAAFLDRPAGSFGVDSASYYSFVTQGAFSVDDVLRSGGLA